MPLVFAVININLKSESKPFFWRREDQGERGEITETTRKETQEQLFPTPSTKNKPENINYH